ncbi:Hsp20/alpha crystallin family protein [bacterium]|nr:Hsp20/alpha crystallin family protein [bacterium]
MSNIDVWRNRSLSPSRLWNAPITTNFFRRMDRLFEDFMNEFTSDVGLRETALHGYEPACDIVERDNDFLICLDLPGMHAKDINVELKGNTLVVSGERKSERKEEKGGTHYHERRVGAFERHLPLPENMNLDKVQANFDSGVLSLTIAKSGQPQRRKINILESGTSSGEVKVEGKSEHKKSA